MAYPHEQHVHNLLSLGRRWALDPEEQIKFVVQGLPGLSRADFDVAQLKGGVPLAVPRADAPVWQR